MFRSEIKIDTYILNAKKTQVHKEENKRICDSYLVSFTLDCFVRQTN